MCHFGAHVEKTVKFFGRVSESKSRKFVNINADLEDYQLISEFLPDVKVAEGTSNSRIVQVLDYFRLFTPPQPQN